MIWILIILATGSSKGSIDHMEFNSQGACVMAAEETKRQFDGTYFDGKAFCVPKG